MTWQYRNICRKSAEEYRAQISAFAWENDRFIRGFYADDSKLGSADSDECKIDILPQSFASIIGGFDPEKVETALETAEKELVDKEVGIIRLFTPPFKDSAHNPGYIKGYIEGIRENGGQYTHASVWYALALFRAGKTEKAYEMLKLINPINHALTLEDAKRYRVEPYVITADIYTNPNFYGMGGWSFYTGAAGWFFKVVTEELLGIKMKNGKIYFDPKMPSSWNDFEVKAKINGTPLTFTAKRGAERFTPKPQAADGKPHNVNFVSE